MQTYTVVGEYGPQGDMNITLEIEAENEGHARNQFCETVEMQHPHEWSRMGRRNVHCMGVVAPPVAPPQTVYEIRYRNLTFGDMIRAHNFWDAVEVAKAHCHERNIPLSDVVQIKYLMY